MNKLCRDCKHYRSGHHYINKDASTEVARITNTERADYFDPRRSETKVIEVK